MKVVTAALAIALALPLLGSAPEASAGPLDDATSAVAASLPALEASTTAQGCDPLDPSHCLLPFPSDHLTVEVAEDEIGGTARGGTGRRITLNPLGMPRNTAGKPIDPTEWNRNDGFSPGQLIMAYVPDLGVERDEDGRPTGPIPNAPRIDDPARYLDPGASVVVIDAETGERHPVWAETDVNAGFLFPPGGERKPGEAKPALLIRPAVNFREGARYVVALRDLHDEDGDRLDAQPFFSSCREGEGLTFPALEARCGQLHDDVFPVLDDAGIVSDDSLYLAWDFTVASTTNTVGRLKHMRDEAFREELGQVENAEGSIVELGRSPDFEVTRTRAAGDFTEIHGSLVVPSYVRPADPSPLETNAAYLEATALLRDEVPGATGDLAAQCREQSPVPQLCDALTAAGAGSGQAAGGLDTAGTVSAPPNRLHYDPTDELHLTDPAMQPYGDGLPDRTGEMEVPFTCRVPNRASAADPARLGTHGHGLLGRRNQFPSQMMRESNHAFCNIDWFGFATGDIANVASLLVDVSNFPVVPDASQQGMLNKLFLLRLLRHPEGLTSHAAFRDADGRPIIDTREVFYYGGSQGGILGGPVIAMSKDVTRAGMRVPGMNYSLLLRRSTGFGLYSMPLYVSYLDDLDRGLAFALIQMLWDRAENNGYATHMLDNSALEGPDNTVLLGAAFADHQVTHWSAENLARTMGVDLADFLPRDPADCEGDTRFCFDSREAFQASGRNPNADLLWGLPLSTAEVFPAGRSTAPYDPLRGNPRRRSALVMFDNGRTASPPLAEIPANHKDSFDPHGHLPDTSPAYRCLQTHFLHPEGRLIDVRGIVSPADCPALP
jgi:hypothetical protein